MRGRELYTTAASFLPAPAREPLPRRALSDQRRGAGAVSRRPAGPRSHSRGAPTPASRAPSMPSRSARVWRARARRPGARGSSTSSSSRRAAPVSTCRATAMRARPRRSAAPGQRLIEALRARASLRGLFVIVDARRGLKAMRPAAARLGRRAAGPRAAVQGRQARPRRGQRRAAHGDGPAGRPRHRAAFLGAEGHGRRATPRTCSRPGSPDRPAAQIKNPGGFVRSRRGRLTRHRSHEPGCTRSGREAGSAWHSSSKTSRPGRSSEKSAGIFYKEISKMLKKLYRRRYKK